jgi:hypothetical protein
MADHPYAKAGTRIQRAKGLCGAINDDDGEPGACIRPWPCEVHGGEVEPFKLPVSVRTSEGFAHRFRVWTKGGTALTPWMLKDEADYIARAINAYPELAALRERERALREFVDEQAEDPGLWFIHPNASEAYLQRALRELHATIEEGIG